MTFWKWVRVVGLGLLAFALLAAAGAVVGQGPEGDGDGIDQGREGVEDVAAAEGIIFAQPPYTMNYQGYLTSSSGDPLNGSYDLTFRLYDNASAGNMEWGPEPHSGVAVTDGLFQVALGSTVTLQPHVFDEALFLAVQVNGADVTPRQPLRSVPYALGLVPGAEVQGDPDTSAYALWVENTGVDATDRGLYAVGAQLGIYAEETGPGNVGIYSPDFVYAAGFKSLNDSYLWVPGTAATLVPDPNCTLYPLLHGTVRLSCSADNTEIIHIPITVPGVLYGQDVRVESITVYYDLDSSASYITATHLRKLTAAVASDSLIGDTTDRKSTSSTSYSLTPTGNYTLTATSGALNLALTIQHDGSLLHSVYLGGVRVRLGHTD